MTDESGARLQMGLPPIFRANDQGVSIDWGGLFQAVFPELPTYKAFIRQKLLPYQEAADDDGECGICLEKMNQKVSLKCGHHYCFQCILEWVMPPELRTCPVCRQNLYVPFTQSLVAINIPALLMKRNLQQGQQGVLMMAHLVRLARSESTLQDADRALKRAYNELDAPSQALARGAEILDWPELEIDVLAMGNLLSYASSSIQAAQIWLNITPRVLDELHSKWRSKYSLLQSLSTPGVLGDALLEAFDRDGTFKEIEVIYIFDADGTRRRGLRPGVDPFEKDDDEEAGPAFFDWQYTRLTDYLASLATR